MQEKLDRFMREWLPPLEAEMRAVLATREPATDPHYAMMQYHMGWVDEHFAPSDLPAGPPVRFLARRGARYLVVPAADVLAFSFEDEDLLVTLAGQLAGTM